MKKIMHATILFSAFLSADCFGMAILDNGRISSTIGRDGTVTRYEYDAIGNIRREGKVKFQYSDAGQLKSLSSDSMRIEYKYDDYGRMISDGDAMIAYNDVNGMMDKYESLRTKAFYDYDELTGLRTSKTVNGKVTHFILDDLGRVVEEQDGFENTIARIIWDGDLPAQYMFSGQTYNYRCNSHGDVVALVDESGAEVNSYSYDIWGKLLKSKESVPNPIRYNHEYQDEETGFYYLRGRYYNPAIRRFTTPDPAEDGINFYAYCGNNPIDYIDPSGYAYFELKEQDSDGYTVNQYYSGEDLAALYKPTTARVNMFKDVIANLASCGLGFFTAKAVAAVEGISIPLIASTAALTIPYALMRYGDDEVANAAFEAYQQGKGLLIIQTISPDSAVYDFKKPKVVPAEDVEDFASGKRKPELFW